MTAAETPLLILAGGKATRLKHLAQDTPKYLQPITADACFADLHLAWAFRQGFRRVILSVGHLGEKIEAHCGDGARHGLNISYLSDGETPVGTGGAVRAALRFPFDSLAITYGDTYLRFSVAEFLKRFDLSGLDGAMTVYRNQVHGHRCNADLDGERLTYNKSAPDPTWAYIDYGFLALKRRAIEAFPAVTPLDLAVPLSSLSLANQLLGFSVEHRFWEIGSPEALAEFRRAFEDDIRGAFDR